MHRMSGKLWQKTPWAGDPYQVPGDDVAAGAVDVEYANKKKGAELSAWRFVKGQVLQKELGWATAKTWGSWPSPVRPSNLMNGKLGSRARGSLPPEVFSQIEPGLEKLFQGVAKLRGKVCFTLHTFRVQVRP